MRVRRGGSSGSTRAVLEESCDGGSSLCSRAQGWPTGEELEQRGVEELEQKGGVEELETRGGAGLRSSRSLIELGGRV